MSGGLVPFLQMTPTATPQSGQAVQLPFTGFLPPWVPPWVLRLIFALLLLLAAWYGSRLVTQAIGRRIARRFHRPSITRTILRSIRTGLLVIAGIASLAILGLRMSDIALSVGVFSAVVGIVLAPIVGSIINGFFVLADRPYEIGDMIEIVDRDRIGYVEDITLRYTKIFTLDNTFLVVPNGTMRERDVINYSAEDARMRMSLDLLVTYESDLAAARELAEEAARSVDEVISGGPDIRIGSARYPAGPTCHIRQFDDHGVLLRLRYWLEEPYQLFNRRSAVNGAVWDRLEGADVTIAYPHSHLVFDENSGVMQVDLGADAAGGSPTGGRGPTADTMRPQPDPPGEDAGG